MVLPDEWCGVRITLWDHPPTDRNISGHYLSFPCTLISGHAGDHCIDLGELLGYPKGKLTWPRENDDADMGPAG